MMNKLPLRLVAQDAEDLNVLASAVQDAITNIGMLRFERDNRRFSFEINRYCWEQEDKKRRVRSLLAFDGVLGVKVRKIDREDSELTVSLLNLEFLPDEEPPGGEVSILFSDDREIRLNVEVLEVTLLDGDDFWPTPKQPSHETEQD